MNAHVLRLQQVPSEDPRDGRASPKVMDLETDLGTSSGGRLARHPKAIPRAHLTFMIDCSRGKQLSLLAPPVPPPALSPCLGPAHPPMKTYILFCGESQPHRAHEAPLHGGHCAQAPGTLPAFQGTVAPASTPVSPLCPQEAPGAKGSPLKTVRYSAWGTVKGSLKGLLSSCVCGQAD
ncbi:steroid receptor-associated and regulated protein [Talpa occidentalis]|uniref:steroid receptor-associated and regulated protein n=1 Tax=Talpa occidentalis TaxID=50954 RepID=UPI0023F92A5F|nr:steroid receptor-associated and regulated protein [Talpa occidentalis]